LSIARELVAGLAAAHDQGIIHRDLKPANVMLDSRGNVKITDFGLAASTEERQGGLVIGTPGYMAPELLRGEKATPRSDLFALGLILYELATARRVFAALSLTELVNLHRAGAKPEPLAAVAPDIDARLARIVDQCLEAEPQRRPPSARAIQEMLPGGDALSAAIEAGETPSPEVVAAAGNSEPLTRTRATLLLATIVLATATTTLLGSRSPKLGILDRIAPPEILRHRAEQISLAWLPREREQDSRWRYEQNENFLAYLEKRDSTAARWKPVYADPSTAIRFWYRRGKDIEPLASASVTFDDPPASSGTIAIRLDGSGNLRTFRAPSLNPAQHQTPLDWNQFFREARLDIREFQKTDASALPPVAADDVRAWIRPRDGLDVVAGSLRYAPVFFEVRAPWDTAPQNESAVMVVVLFVGVWLLLTIAGVMMARVNMNRGRGDTRSAWRLACFVFITWTLQWILTSSTQQWQMGIAYAFFAAVETWLAYVALEPHVRRRWPRVLIGWKRLLSGRLRDPRVGRDVLIGFAIASAARLLLSALTTLMLHLGLPEARPTAILHHESLSRMAGEVFYDQFLSVTLALADLFLLLLFGFAVKRLSIVVGIITTLLILIFVPMGAGVAVIVFIVPLIVMLRYRLLATVCCFYGVFLEAEALTFDFTKWYGHSSIVALALIAGFAIYGYLTSQEQRRLAGIA